MATRSLTTEDVLDERDAAALTEYMTVVADSPRTQGAPGLYVVVSGSGRSYLVDADGGACECDDSLYRAPKGGCKHARKVAYSTGRKPIPAWVDQAAIDPKLGEHTDGNPCIKTPDGTTEVVNSE
jgi:hypothetical protein